MSEGLTEMEAATQRYVCTPESEDTRYSRLFRQGYGVGPIHDLYGAAKAWSALEGVQSAIDVGCGRGMAIGVLLNAGIKRVVGTDISSYAVKILQTMGFDVHQADCRTLAKHFQEREFDLVWSCDMMEHLPPEWVPDALKAMYHVCGKMAIFNISTRKSVTLDEHGANLHLTVQPADWWREQVQRAGFVERQCQVKSQDVCILAIRA